MVRRVGSVVGPMLVVCGLLAGCGSRPVVGVLLPTSGVAATYGESIESGMRLAISDARASGQLPAEFEVLWADTGSDPDRAAAELERMATERDVRLVLGGVTTGEARALIPRLDDLDVICLSPSASAPELSKQSRNFFRIYPSDEIEGQVAGTFLAQRLQVQRLVTYVGDTDYTRGIEPEFLAQYEEAYEGTVVERIDLTEPGWRDRSATVLGGADVQAAFVIAYAEPTLEVLRHLQEEGFEGRRVATSAFYSSRVIHEAGELTEGLLLPLPPFDRTSEDEPVASFVQRYMDTYQRAPDVYAAHGYDAMRVAVEILTIARPPESSELRKALSFGIMDFNGVTGPILFDDHGDVKHYPKMFIVDGGQVMTYQRYIDIQKERILGDMRKILQGRAEPTPAGR